MARAGDFDKAIELFRMMLDLDSNNVEARNNIGVTYRILGRYSDALELYLQAADLVKRQYGDNSEDLAKIYTNIGIIYNNKQDFELALQYFSYVERIVEVNDLKTNIALIRPDQSTQDSY